MTMNGTTSVISIDLTCNEAVERLVEQLRPFGFMVRQTFDLQSARQMAVDCPCPHHGTANCDCQMVVMLVYHGSHVPITVIAHGYDQHTWFSMVDTPAQRADPWLEATLRHLATIPPYYAGSVTVDG